MNTSDVNENARPDPVKKDKNFLNSVVIGGLGVVSGLYLMFPGSSAVQLAIEWIPVIGQIDEVAAAAFLFSALSYFGLDLTSFFNKKKQYDEREAKDGTPAKGKVVDPS